MFADVGGGWININLLANLTPNQLKTAHIEEEFAPDGFCIDAWLDEGEYVTLGGGFKEEKVAEMVLYFIKPKLTSKDYKDLKVDGLTVFEFRPKTA